MQIRIPTSKSIGIRKLENGTSNSGLKIVRNQNQDIRIKYLLISSRTSMSGHRPPPWACLQQFSSNLYWVQYPTRLRYRCSSFSSVKMSKNFIQQSAALSGVHCPWSLKQAHNFASVSFIFFSNFCSSLFAFEQILFLYNYK